MKISTKFVDFELITIFTKEKPGIRYYCGSKKTILSLKLLSLHFNISKHYFENNKSWIYIDLSLILFDLRIDLKGYNKRG